MDAELTRSIRRARRQTVGDVLRRTALRSPERLAVVDGPTRMTYAELDAAVNRLASSLTARGVARGERLALLSHNSWHYAVTAFATAKLGVILVPVNFMLGRKEIAYILEHSSAVAFLVEDDLAGTATEAMAQGGGVRLRGWIGLHGHPAPEGWEDVEGWIAGGDPAEPDVDVDDDDTLRLMYTSGTESRPKGAALSSRSLIAQYVSCIVDGEMAADDVEVHSLPLYHCAQLDCFLIPDVYLGATSVILPGPDPAALLRAVEEHRATKLFAPPTVWISLLRHESFATTDLSSLRKGYYGASPMPVEVLREMRERLRDVRLWNFYGQTEMAPLATILQPHLQLSHAGSAGRPAINVETRIVDDEGEPVPAGTVGEIVHRSPQATTGYWEDEARTAEAFRGGWFHSGDLGVMSEDGYLSVVDRKKDMIKSGGENVASREVEEVIHLLPEVSEVAVFGLPHPRWIEAVTAVVVLMPGAELDDAALVAHCREHLAGFKCPKHVAFVDALPKNPSGKILKRELRVAHAWLASDDA